jgi:hypothetical protein
MKVWSIGVLVTLTAGCSGLPLEPASYRESTGVSAPSIVGTPVAGTQPLVPAQPDPEPPAGRTPTPEPEPVDSAPPPKAVEPIDPSGPPVEPPTIVTCPAGFFPTLRGDVITCELPPTELTCPAGTQPVLGETLKCE